jgi:hypothetical protein
LQPVELDADAGAIWWAIRERAVERVLFGVGDVGIGVEVVSVFDRLAEGALEVLPQLEVIEAITSLEALPNFE